MQLKVKAMTAAGKSAVWKGPRCPHKSKHCPHKSGSLMVSASLLLVGRKRKEEGDIDRIELTKACQGNAGVISIKQFIFHALELVFQEKSSYLSGCSA